MVSVLPAPGAPPEFYYGGHHHHVPRLSTSTKNIHLRSQSMPEAVYIQHQQHVAVQPQHVHFKPRVRHQSGQKFLQPVVHHAPPPASGTGLRRSHTNVADFRSRTRYWKSNTNEGCDFPGLYLARSRSNIAALGLNPEVVYRPSQVQFVKNTGISRAASFYHHRDLPMQSARSLSFLASAAASRSSLAVASSSCKDLSQPLHVDCSVEYDLGNQPKIPKDSAPLLIIHPAYVQQKQQQLQETTVDEAQHQPSGPRFHPYSSTSITTASSPYSEADHKSKSSSGHGTSLASSSISSSTSSSSRLPPGQRYPSSASKLRSNGVSRHSSFLVTSPPRMVGLEPASIIQETPKNKSLEHKGHFHLSMPDIGLDQKHPRPSKLAASGGQILHNKKAQHRHHHGGPGRARLNLNAKLEAVRKLSSEADNNSSHCDSGLGTPISLMDEVSSSMTSNSSGGSSHLSKWRSSMSGIVTGFFCCSMMPPPPETPTSHGLPRISSHKKQPLHRGKDAQVYICAPVTQPPRLSVTEASEEELWEEKNPRNNHPSWLLASPASNCIVSSSSSLASQPPPPPQQRLLPMRPTLCRWCQSSNPGEDCRDGFCSSVWNKENLMRPIHI